MNDDVDKLLNAELSELDGFQLKAEVIARRSECERLRNALAEKERIALRLLSLKEELKTKTAECENLKLKIKKAEEEAKIIFKRHDGR